MKVVLPTEYCPISITMGLACGIVEYSGIGSDVVKRVHGKEWVQALLTSLESS